MMDCLEVPLHRPRRSIETNQRLCKQIGPRTAATIVIAAWCGGRQIQKTACLIERHRSPDVAVTVGLPRIVVPGLSARIPCRLRDYRKCPDAFAGARIDGLNVADRLRRLHTIRYLASHDNQVLIDNRRRALSGVLDVTDAWQID